MKSKNINSKQVSTAKKQKKPTMTNLEISSESPKTSLVVLPVQELTKIIEDAVCVALQNHQSQHPQTQPEEEFLNANETIAFLRVSRPTFQTLRKLGKLPAVMASDKRILFRKSDLVHYLNSRHESNSQ